MYEEKQKDRLSAYVENYTTQLIVEIKRKYYEEHGIRLSVGQTVDIMARNFIDSKEE